MQLWICTRIGTIANGFVDYDKAYEKALVDLKAAGIDKYVAEYQK